MDVGKTSSGDPAWPKTPLPNNWIFGNMSGVHVDEKDHVWILQRGNTVQLDLGDDYLEQVAAGEALLRDVDDPRVFARRVVGGDGVAAIAETATSAHSPATILR